MPTATSLKSENSHCDNDVVGNDDDGDDDDDDDDDDDENQCLCLISSLLVQLTTEGS